MHAENLGEFILSKGIPSTDILAYHNHKEIYRHMSGYKDSAKTVSIKGDELYFLYSATKVITCTAAMRLVERGVIGIDDPVSKYIPEYADLKYIDKDGVIKPCKNVMTIRHLFAMRGGLTYNLTAPAIKEVLAKTNGKASTLDIVRAFPKDPLIFEPGTNFNYSLCHDVLAAVVEIASGMRFGKYLQTNIFDPLEMKNTGFFPTDEDLKRFPAQYRYTDDKYVEVPLTCVYRLSENYESGGAGLYSCVNDYIKVGDALANHGTAYNGYQLLRPETVELMRSNQNPIEALGCFSKKGYGYGFGVRTMLCPEMQQSDAPTEAEFGWDGAAGFYVSIDAKHRLCTVYAQQVLGHTWTYSDVHPVIRDSMYYIAGICK